MPRRGNITKHTVLADPVYNNVMVSEFINRLILDGKKSIAENIFYDALGMIEEKTGTDPIETFDKGLKNVMPMLEVRPRRVGGATYQVPMEVRPERRKALALRWVVANARKRSEKTMSERLAGEIMDAANGVGNSVKKREDMHKMAEANKAFSHYRI